MSSKCFFIMIKVSDFFASSDAYNSTSIIEDIFLCKSIIYEDTHDHHLEC
jgi:hypothetical protein